MSILKRLKERIVDIMFEDIERTRAEIMDIKRFELVYNHEQFLADSSNSKTLKKY